MGADVRNLEEKLHLLVDASATLLQSAHLDSPAPEIVHLARELNAADASAIWRFDAAEAVWKIMASTGLSPGSSAWTAPEGSKRVLREQGLSSVLSLPLKITDGRGALAIYYRAPRRFTRAERRAASAVCRLASAALETSELQARNRVMMEVALRALREREERLQMAMDAGRLGIWEWDLETGRVHGCERLKAMHGLPAEGWDGRYETFLRTIHPDDRQEFEQAISRAVSDRGNMDHEYRIQPGGDEERWVASSGRVICDAGGRPVRWIGVDRDVTWRRQLEQKVNEAQQMESIALLAAGVAHKFNNLLTGIMGHASVAAQTMSCAGLNTDALDHVVSAAKRAGYLTRQLLAYSGQGMVTIRRLNLSTLARQAGGFFRATAPPNIRLEMSLADKLPNVEGDSALLEQAALNLLINASEAIGDEPGRIVMRTGEVADPESAGTGRYVYLEVADTGCGMDAATQARIFDPFFSTKFIGRGLGLAAVSGIMRRHGGSIRVSSEPAKGSTFCLLLPVAQHHIGRGNAAGDTVA
jgi:PAS domain S-box-containing protein